MSDPFIGVDVTPFLSWLASRPAQSYAGTVPDKYAVQAAVCQDRGYTGYHGPLAALRVSPLGMALLAISASEGGDGERGKAKRDSPARKKSKARRRVAESMPAAAKDTSTDQPKPEPAPVHIESMSLKVISDLARMTQPPPAPLLPIPPKPEVAWLDDGRLRIGDRIVKLDPPIAAALKALVERGAASSSDLASRSMLDDPGRELRKLVKKFPESAPYITLPGRKGSGGYRTTIRAEPGPPLSAPNPPPINPLSDL
jgi:hypothetical protein